MVVKEYVQLAEKASVGAGLSGEMQLVNEQQTEALLKFQQYLTGFRGVGRPTSPPKAAVVLTQTYKLVLKPSTSIAAGLSFVIMPGQNL